MNRKRPGQLYRKLFGIYSAMILTMVLILMVFFLGFTRARVLEINLDYLKMMQEKAVSYLDACAVRTDRVQEELYQSDDVFQDLLYYLQNGDQEYQEYRLNHYMKMDSFDYNGFDDYAETALKTDSDILHIDFLSYQKGELTSCGQDGRIFRRNLEQEELERIAAGDLAGQGELGFLKEIRDSRTMESVGSMIVMFSAEPFEEYKLYYQKPDIFVVNQNHTVIADSAGDGDIQILEEAEDLYVGKEIVKDYTVYTFLDKREAGRIQVTRIFTILILGAAVTIAGESLVYWYLNRFARRLNYILEGMQKVTVGDLTVRLAAAAHGDELDLISSNFNEMCEKLERYIQQSYLAEIEQKNAELEILQNQINPHFLYNTLEAIRMKAICNKDRQVAKMLYSMAVIFRSQLKEADVITLVQELHYCKKYLELFEYRYQDKFCFSMDCPEAYMDIPVIKFIVQPILENYFAHGIYGERAGNEIHIYAEKTEDSLWIHVRDNGRGMDREQMEQMNRTLRENTDTSRNSIGLRNVNRRLKAVYGPPYGVELKQNETGGLHVILKVGTGKTWNEEK